MVNNGILYSLKDKPGFSYGHDFDTISINDGKIVIKVGGEERAYNLASMSKLVIFPLNMTNNHIPCDGHEQQSK